MLVQWLSGDIVKHDDFNTRDCIMKCGALGYLSGDGPAETDPTVRLCREVLASVGGDEHFPDSSSLFAPKRS